MKSLKAYVLLLSLLAFGQVSTSCPLSDILKAVNNADLVKDITNLLESPLSFFKMAIPAIARYPLQFVSCIINDVCSLALATKAIIPMFTPDIHKMKFQLRTACEKFNFPLLEANQMWRSPKFNATKKVVILATGWATTINCSETIEVFAKAYCCRGDINFVIVDAASYVDTLYIWAVLNTEAIGEAVATGLVQLSQIVPIGNIHLIGHSLGAHIVGAAARKFSVKTGHKIEHITALDPARPCFNKGDNQSGLKRGDATFIDVIHSNPGVLGIHDPLGDADFYPGGLDPLPFGCLDVTCAHKRAWEYYAETIYLGNERNFMAKRCSSFSKLLSKQCLGSSIPMGYAVPCDVNSTYILDVNSKKPYGKAGSKDREASNKNCGLCKNACSYM